MLTERCRCLVNEITVENTDVERTVIMDSCHTVFRFDTVTALVEVFGILVLASVVYMPTYLLLQLMYSLDRLLVLHGVESVTTLYCTHDYQQKPP